MARPDVVDTSPTGDGATTTTSRAASVAVLATVAAMLPVFLTTALWVQVREDIDAAAYTLGAIVAGHFLAAGALSSWAGRLADRLGAEVGVRIGTGAAGTLLALIAVAARDVTTISVLLVLCGMAMALSHPATSLFLAQRVPTQQQGFAFAIRECGSPSATLLGGAAVPLLALTVGWRWAYLAAAGVAFAAALAVPRRRSRPARAVRDLPPRDRRPTGRPQPFGPLLLVSVAAAAGGTAPGALLAFYVTGAVETGMSASTAGWALTAGSAGVVVARIVQGRLADRRGRRHLPVIATLMGLGLVGHALLAVGEPALHLVAVPLAFVAGWSWPGIYLYAVVRIHPATPGAATGVAQTGAFIGGVIGPLAFGAIAHTLGFGWAWAFSGAASGVGGLLLVAARRWYLAADLTRAPAPGSSTPDLELPPPRAAPTAVSSQDEEPPPPVERS